MALQKKVNKLQVEHVSEEEVDQVREREQALAPASLNAFPDAQRSTFVPCLELARALNNR